ncbi:MAG: NAD-binding oxidoreductase [Nitrospirota bacterium]|nr:NAD-binding oxidoreductase [Nitrospirota bacterium]
MADAPEWQQMKVASAGQEGLHMRHVVLTPDAPFRFTHGQYVQLRREDGDKPGFFAIASAPHQDREIEFLVKEGSGVAGALYEAAPGDVFQVGPAQGPGFPREHLLGKNVVLIGVGSGMAPLRSVLLSILDDRAAFGERVMLVYGARTPFHIPFRPEIARWRAQVEVYKAMSQPGDTDWSGYTGYVQHILEDVDIPRENTIACVCGMSHMVDAVKERLAALGIAEDDVYLNF